MSFFYIAQYVRPTLRYLYEQLLQLGVKPEERGGQLGGRRRLAAVRRANRNSPYVGITVDYIQDACMRVPVASVDIS